MPEQKSLWVSLKGRTNKFDRAMKRARSRLRRLRASFDRLRRSIPGVNLLLSKFGAALTVGGFAYFTSRALQSIDTVAKLSDRLRISTEALVGFQHAAAITGLEGDNLNKGLEVLSRRIGEARQGMGEGVRVLNQLRLSARSLALKPLGEAFIDVAEAIEGLATQADKAAAANALFGRSGVRLLNLFQLGRSGLKAMREEAEQLGLTFSRVDAAQVEMANDAMTRLRGVLTGLFRRIAVGLAPLIKALTDRLIGLGAAIQSDVADVVLTSVEAMAKAFGKLPAVFDVIQGAWDTLVASFQVAIAAWLIGLADTFDLVNKLARVGGLGVSLPDGADPGAGARRRAGQILQSVDQRTSSAAESFNRARERTAAVERFFSELRQNVRQEASAIAEQAQARLQGQQDGLLGRERSPGVFERRGRAGAIVTVARDPEALAIAKEQLKALQGIRAAQPAAALTR